MFPRIAVIYLFRKGDSPDEMERFLASYKKHPAGMEHSFYLFYKGIDFEYHFYNICNLGRDLYSYRTIANRLPDYEYLVFFNSHTEIICDNWLREMMKQTPQCSLVGTSFSQESFYTNAKGRFSLLNWLRKLLYHEYPNYHIRTNGFLIERKLMLQVWPRWLFTKQLCYLFESGKNNLTNRVNRLGFKTITVCGLVKDNMQCNSHVCRT